MREWVYLKHEQRAVQTGVLHNKRGWQHYIGNYGKCHGWCFANYISFTSGRPQLLWNQRGKAQKINLFSGKNLSCVLKKKLSFQKKKNESHYVKFKNQQIFLYPKQMARFKNNFTPVTSFYALSLRSGEWNGNPEHHCWNLISTLEEFFSHLHHKLSQEILRLPVKILTV